jgi:threonine/homoserine/homoserine lactone efflux protein
MKGDQAVSFESPLLSLIAAVVIFAVVPGPAMLYTAARTLAGGRKAGLMAALGIHLGGYLHVGAAALGLSVALHSAPELFSALKLLGAAYLAWLGVALFRNHGLDNDLADISRQSSWGGPFSESLTVEVLNPATAIFFVAFLPLFVDPMSSVPVWVQLVLLGALTNLIFSLAEIIVVIIAGTLMLQFRQGQRAQSLIRRAAGSALVALALHMGLGGVIAAGA